MTKGEWALYLANLGFQVFPLRPNSKQPLYRGWQDIATTDPGKIATLWEGHPNANIGIHCDGVGVVDLDVKNGKDGIAAWEALGGSFDTLTFQTPSGGLHLVFNDPDRHFINSAGLVGPGIDTRGFG